MDKEELPELAKESLANLDFQTEDKCSQVTKVHLVLAKYLVIQERPVVDEGSQVM